MKSILMAIHPEFCCLIVSGQKTIEIRKIIPKLKTPFKVYVYCTLPKKSGDAFLIGKAPICANGKVICEFICRNISEYESEFYKGNDCYQDIREIFRDPDNPDDDCRDFCILTSNEDDYPDACELCDKTCLSFEEIKAYIGEGFCKTFYGLHISDLVIYDKPKELSEFRKRGALSYDDWLYSMYNGTSESSYEKYLLPFTLTRPPQSWCYVETKN
ncbi:MAG: hypothetical protein ACI4KH_00810 [Oscillospiraceae bacterium]